MCLRRIALVLAAVFAASSTLAGESRGRSDRRPNVDPPHRTTRCDGRAAIPWGPERPIIITRSGSYVLARNLDGDGDSGRILVQLPGGGSVDLDLNGFRVGALATSIASYTTLDITVHDGSVVGDVRIETTRPVGGYYSDGRIGAAVVDNVRTLGDVFICGAAQAVVRSCIIGNVFVSKDCVAAPARAVIEDSTVQGNIALAGEPGDGTNFTTSVIRNNRVAGDIVVHNCYDCGIGHNTLEGDVTLEYVAGSEISDNVLGILSGEHCSANSVARNVGETLAFDGFNNRNRIDANHFGTILLHGDGNVYTSNIARGHVPAPDPRAGCCSDTFCVWGEGNSSGGDNFLPAYSDPAPPCEK